MNGAIFMLLLTACSIVTSVATEVEKKLFSDFSTNIIAMITGFVIGGVVTALYYFFKNIAYVDTTIVYFVLVCVGSGVGSMIGYDKVIQTVNQVKNTLKD